MKKLALLLIFILLSIVVYGLFTKGEQFTSPIVAPNLQRVVEQSLNAVSGRYAVYIKNLKTGESVSIRENEIFEAGSLYKLWVMGAVFEKIKNGDLTEDDNLEADIEDLNKRFEISQEDAEIKEGHLQFTVSSAIRQMITISHNYAALILLEKVGADSVGKFLKKYNLGQSEFEPRMRTTAQDLGQFLGKLHQGEVVDAKYSQKMIDILAKQQINNRLPKYLPEGTKIAHKTGNSEYFENDAGIVYSPAGDYIIVVLTETNNPLGARDKIGRISEAVYMYFNR